MRTLVLVPVLTRARAGHASSGRAPNGHSPQDRLAEAAGLARAIDLDVADARLVPVPAPKRSSKRSRASAPVSSSSITP